MTSFMGVVLRLAEKMEEDKLVTEGLRDAFEKLNEAKDYLEEAYQLSLSDPDRTVNKELTVELEQLIGKINREIEGKV